MIIACPSCASRYQLADAKVKPTGTKVRCPRCNHKFVVFPESPDEPATDQTELFARRDGLFESEAPQNPVAKKAAQPASPPKEPEIKSRQTNVRPKKEAAESKPPPPPPPPAHDPFATEDEDSFAQPTRTYSAEELAQLRGGSKKNVDPVDEPTAPPQFQATSESNFASEDSEKSFSENFESDEGMSPGESPSPDTGQDARLQPFGDQTLFEIQKADKKGKRRSGKFITVAIACLLIAGGFYFFPILQKKLPLPSVPQSAELARPSGWYRDDPTVYQDEMVRQAGLPKTEKERPENLALIAEALVLNGILTSSDDQVNQGLMFSQRVQLMSPNSVLAHYAISANAIAQDNSVLVDGLIQTWPAAQQSDPEYRLLRMVHLLRAEKFEEGFEELKNLLGEFPDFQRANDLAYLFILQNGEPSSRLVPLELRNRVKARYETQRSALEKTMKQLPKLYLEIDAMTGRKPPTPQEPIEPPAATAKPKEAAPDKPKPAAPPPKEVEKPKPKEKPKRITRLPPPSVDLKAERKQAETNETESRRFFADGNEAYKRGDIERALQLYRQALEKEPNFAEVYKQLGVLYMEQKRAERAIKSFKIYLELRPNSKDKQVVEGWISSLQ